MSDGVFGQQLAGDAGSDFNVTAFIVRQMLGDARDGIPVVVKAVHGGGTASQPAVDVQPLINPMDGQGIASAHGVINGLPVFRPQGGSNTIIIDPAVGDVGWLMVADRDTSALRANAGKQSNPGSFRRFSLSDGFYIGAYIAVSPTQYLQFTSSGVKIADKNGNLIEMTSGGIKLTGNVEITGSLKVDGDANVVGGVTAGVGGADSVGLQTHKHTGNNIPPTPGT